MRQEAWIREAERPFIRNAEDWCAQTDQNQRWYLTDFLTPRAQFLTRSIVGRYGLEMALNGGYPDAERQRLLIMPGNWQPVLRDFEVTYLRAEAQAVAIRHKDVLGSILGLGIQRRTIGDISIDGPVAHVFVANHMVRFLYDTWRQVGNSSVLLSQPSDIPKLPAPKYDEKDITVASLRLDAVVAHACQLSRGKSQAAVDRGDVTLNFMDAGRNDEIAEGDILSLRGFGRIKILSVAGLTKRERLKLRVGILRSNA